jgi:hypothetical protein
MNAKFSIGDIVFVCDGGEYHGTKAKITAVDTSYSTPRYGGILLKDNSKFRFEKESGFCAIETSTCELCGSPEGIVKPPYPVPEFGDAYDLAKVKFPYAVSCICPKCQHIFDLRDEKLRARNKLRSDFREAETARRKKEHLCHDCGGKIVTSGPYMVYEGTYETIHRCTQCKNEDRYT